MSERLLCKTSSASVLHAAQLHGVDYAAKQAAALFHGKMCAQRPRQY